MNKWRFVDRGGNLASKGFIKDCLYNVDSRSESKQTPERFFVVISGPGFVTPVSIWEKTLNAEFSEVHPEQVPQPIQQSFIPPPPVIPIQTPTPETYVQKPSVSEIVHTNADLSNRELAVKVDRIAAMFEGLKTSIEMLKSTTSSHVEETKDLLLSELIKLDFQSLNLNLLKYDGKMSFTIIIDGMPPFTINSGGLSAENVVKQITDNFSEEMMLINSIKKWNLELKELAAKREEEVKKAKSLPDIEKSTVKSRRTKAEMELATAPQVIVPDPEPESEPQSEPAIEPEPGFQAQIPTDLTVNDGLSDKARNFELL